MSNESFFIFAVVLIALGMALIAALRWHNRRRMSLVRAGRSSESYDTFRNSFGRELKHEAAATVVYSALARSSDGGPDIPPRRRDRLWKDQGIDYPEELAEYLSAWLGELGVRRTVDPTEILDLRTVGDAVLWLDQHCRSAQTSRT